MESILLGLAVLACPIGMGLMMWMMGKGMIGGKKEGKEEPATLGQIREEQDALAAQVAKLELERSGGHVQRADPRPQG